MKKCISNTLAVLAFVVLSFAAQAQVLKPVFSFHDLPKTHNMHIASDGSYYYCINGGIADSGSIHKYSFRGRLLESYPLHLDSRSIMYNETDKTFYLNTYDKNIYKIKDMKTGAYELFDSELYDDGQECLAMTPDGKLIYDFLEGNLVVWNWADGIPEDTYYDLDSGSEVSTGSECVATDGKYIYTWNAAIKTIYVYDLDGKKVKSVEISDGSYGFSLSCAQGLVFVSDDGNYGEGTWYGYDLWAQ